MNFFKHKSLLGVSIRPCSINIVSVEKLKEDYEVQFMDEILLPQKLFSFDKIVDFHYVEKQLSKLVQKHNLQHQEVSISIPYSLAVASQTLIPKGLTENAIRRQIQMEVKQHIKEWDIELGVDFCIESTDREDYQLLRFVVVRKAYLQRYLQCMQSAALRVRNVEIDVVALTRYLFGGIANGRFVWQQQEIVHVIEFVNAHIDQYRYFSTMTMEHAQAEYRSDAVVKRELSQQYHVAAGLALWEA